MTGDGAVPKASRQALLDPLWALTTGIAAGIGLAIVSSGPGSRPITLVLGLSGILLSALALHLDGRSRVLFLLAAGLALGGARGLEDTVRRARLERIIEDPAPIAFRIEGTILEGWSPGLWGRTTRIRIIRARRPSGEIDLPRRCRIEVRNAPTSDALPTPGTTVEILAAIKGPAERPLLVVASPGIIKPTGTPSGLPALRDRLARSMIRAAGTDVERLRAAELAGALALGRRDLLPDHRRRGWRDSGLGHALAVSGLHVGIVAGTLWLIGVAIGTRPRTIRVILLILVPFYTLLAGAAPSAVRACLMLCLYLGARLLGRAVLPLGAILAATATMLLANPSLIADAGFQLTIVVTAALIRWSPSLAEFLRGPRWLRAAIAVPLVAQAAAAPLIALHFRQLIPWAAIVNLAVPLMLTPAIPLSVGAACLAPLSPGGAGILLDLIGNLTGTLWSVGGLGRSWILVTPVVPILPILISALTIPLALRYDRWGRAAGTAWLILLAFFPISAFQTPDRDADSADLLPVGEGLSLLMATGGETFLFDGGRSRIEAARFLADNGIRHLDLVFASHGDEDHIGGLATVLRSTRVERLIVPSWLIGDPEVVPILRAARDRKTAVAPVARGSIVRVGTTRLDVLWPPAVAPPPVDNDRSLVVRVRTPSGGVLLTADIPASIEAKLARISFLRSDVLAAPHHGSRTSTSTTFLDAVSPKIVLIPAGPRNHHHHPHPTVLNRLSAREISFVYPLRDGQCGARADGPHRWRVTMDR